MKDRIKVLNNLKQSSSYIHPVFIKQGTIKTFVTAISASKSYSLRKKACAAKMPEFSGIKYGGQ